MSSSKAKARQSWVEPASLPNADSSTLEHYSVENIQGNAPLRAKQFALNTFASYGVGAPDIFGHGAGRKVKFVRMSVESDPVSSSSFGSGTESSEGHEKVDADGSTSRAKGKGDTSIATVDAELVVDKTMLNGAGMMHGGCIAYLIDNCGSMPLIVLGTIRGLNAVGVTQALNILFHAPAPLGTTLLIRSQSLSLGGRSMTAKCEIFNKTNGRLVASAFINKMEPKL